MVVEVSELIGKTVISIDKKDDELIFICDTGEKYKMYHSRDCCESVSIDDDSEITSKFSNDFNNAFIIE